MKKISRFFAFFILLSCTPKTPVEENGFLGTWQLVDLLYEYQEIALDLESFATIVSYEDEIPKSEVLDCMEGLQLEFTEDRYRFYKTVTNSFCSDEFYEVSGTYIYKENRIAFLENSILEADNERIVIEDKQLKIMYTEDDLKTAFFLKRNNSALPFRNFIVRNSSLAITLKPIDVGFSLLKVLGFSTLHPRTPHPETTGFHFSAHQGDNGWFI